MQKRFILLTLVLVLAALACQMSGTTPQPEPAGETLFDGVTYLREVRTSPRPLVIHIVQIDLRTQGISAFVTPGDATREKPLDARTTSAFLQEFDLQIAINGDGFTPWSTNPLAPYPKPGDPVTPLGLAISNGVPYAQPLDNHPTLYFSPNGKASLNDPPGNIAFAISGLETLIRSGKIVPGLEGGAEPRTALGLNRAGKILTLVVVDGRQPGYSEGVTLPELAALLLEYGVHDGINMDGGGSSTLVVEGEDGQPLILNSPIDSNFPGRERPVANHLGFYAKGK
ncbi:MAG: hypothetical protein Fur0022_16790 [Anaerolineales bacterium]